MAKGDDARARNRIDQQGGLGQEHINNLRNEITPWHQGIMNRYNATADRAIGDYNNMWGRFNEFANTGGYSRDDLSNIRARSVSPIRSVYANANREVDRAKGLSGGYMPNYAASKAKMAREMSSGISDASRNVEGDIAQMVQQGKLAGMSGMLSSYGATPGMANMFGEQAGQGFNQRLGLEELQNRLGLGLIDAQIGAGQLPGNWEHTMGRIGDIANLGAGLIYPWMGGGGAGNLPSGGGGFRNMLYQGPSAGPSRNY